MLILHNEVPPPPVLFFLHIIMILRFTFNSFTTVLFSFLFLFIFFDNRDITKVLFTLPELLGKETIDRIRRAMNQTGGGPPPPELTPADQLLWESMSEIPVMTRLSVTIDTDGKHLFLSHLFNADN